MTFRSTFSANSFSIALTGGTVIWGCSAFAALEVQAACVQTGATVDCTGNDFNGFLSSQSLTLRIHPGAFIQNIITNETLGVCPLSFPAIEVGAKSSVLNEGTISTAGVCGFGMLVDSDSSIVNRGSILTSDFISYGIIANENVSVRNSGSISTTHQGSGGIFGYGNIRVDTDAGSSITTTGQGASGVEVGATSVVTNAGRITVRGDVAMGIDAAAGSSVINSGTIETSANNSIGVRVAGGNVTNSGSIRSVLTGPAFAFTPTVGVSITGSAAQFENTASGSVVATHIAVRLSGTQQAGFSNAGRIEVSPALQIDGTMSSGGAALVVAGSTSVDVSNSGTIIARGGLPAILSLGSAVTLANSGSIVGDIVLSGGSDQIIVRESSSIDGVIDFGGGDDLIAFQNGGVLERSIINVERLSQSGANTLIISRDVTVGQQVLVLGGGGMVIGRNVRVTAPVTENIGIIRGHGILDGAINNGGLVAPGSASEKGTLTISGAFRQFSNGTVAIRLSPDGTSDRLVVGGPATFAGTLTLSYQLVPGAASFRDGQRYEILSPAAATLVSTGQFTLAAPEMAFVTANLVTTSSGGLAVVMDRRSYDTAAVTPTQGSVGRMLDRLQAARPAALASTFEQLEAAAPQAATALLASFAPEAPGAVQALGLLSVERFSESIRRRAPSGTAAGRFVWARGFSSSGQSREATARRDYDLQGGAAGIETHVGAMRLGVAAARIDGDFAGSADHAAFDASIFALTAHFDWSKFSVDGAMAYGTGSPEIRRLRLSGGTSETLVADAHTNLWSISVDGSYAWIFDTLAVSPHAGFSYNQASLNALDERQPLAIRTADASARSLRARVGAGVSVEVGRIRPFGDLSMSIELLDRRPRIPALLIGVPDSNFDLLGDARRRLAVEAEVGVSVVLSEGLEAHVAGAMTANDLLAGRRLSAGLTYRW